MRVVNMTMCSFIKEQKSGCVFYAIPVLRVPGPSLNVDCGEDTRSKRAHKSCTMKAFDASSHQRTPL